MLHSSKTEVRLKLNLLNKSLNFWVTSAIVFVQSVFVYCFSDQYNTINDFIFIYLSHSPQHVWPVIVAIIGWYYNNIKGKSEVEASLLQLKYKLIIMLYQKLDDKMYIIIYIYKMVKMLQCPSDMKYE